MAWSRHERAQRARTKLKRAARAYVEAADRYAAPGWDLGRGRAVLESWRRLVHAAALLTHALEETASKD